MFKYVFFCIVSFLCLGGLLTPKAFSSPFKAKTMNLPDMVNEFYRHFPESKKDGVMKFIFLPESKMIMVNDKIYNNKRKAHGVCIPNDKTITLNSTWWKRETNNWRKLKVVFHELGHCELGLDHPSNVFANEIMGYNINLVTDGSDWDYFVNKMKRKVK